jgi:hypothetical protein
MRRYAPHSASKAENSGWIGAGPALYTLAGGPNLIAADLGHVMPNRGPFSIILPTIAVLSAIASPALAQVLKKEPPMGLLREGETVLVDDGTCPAGQIKQVVGGNHVKVGGTKHILRTYHCIPK